MTSLFRRGILCVMCASMTTLNAAPPVSGAQGGAKPLPDALAATGETLTAQSIPSLPGFVRSPYTNPPQLVNVKGATPGSMMICPYTQRPFIIPADFEDAKDAPSAIPTTGPEPKAAKHTAQSTDLKPETALSGKPAKDAAVVLPVSDSAWRVSIGAQWRQIGNVDWQTGSAAASSSLPWLVGRGRNSGGSSTSSIPSGVGDHSYDDGFVNVDSSGASSGSTWFWGYNNASQIQGTDLVFHATEAGSSSFHSSASSSVRNSSWSDDLEGAGVFAKLESPELLRIGGIGVSLEFGYSWAQDESSNVTRDVFQAAQTSRLVTISGGALEDRYDVTGLTLPPAPYAGTFFGPGVIIPNAPYLRTHLGGGESTSTTQTAVFSSEVSEHFEVNLHTLSFGPRVNMECCKDVRVGLGLGLALNIADWNADYAETLSVRQNGGRSRVLKRWEASESGTDVLAGFYLEASCQVRVAERVSAYVAGRYDWSDNMTEQVGPSRVHFEPGGWSVMLGVTVTL